MLWALTWFTFAFLLVGPFMFHLLQIPGSEDLPRVYAAVALPAAVLALTNLLHTRKTILAVNRVALSTRGLYPPFKPNRYLMKGDWFIPYGDIVSMVPVTEKKGFVPAYDVTLRDGLTFQLSALDLLLYVREREARRYGRMLAVIKEEIEKSENRARASRGEEIVIPGARFEASLD